MSTSHSPSDHCISHSQYTGFELAPLAAQESFTDDPIRGNQRRSRMYFTGSTFHHTSPREQITSTPSKAHRALDFGSMDLESPVSVERQISPCVSPVSSSSTTSSRPRNTVICLQPHHSQVLLTSIRNNGNTSALSSNSIICRICHEGDSQEELVSPCRCAGTMGRIHLTCAEKWLSSSNRKQCEICGIEYVTKREPRPFIQWFQSPAHPSDKRNLVGDAMCFLLLTPLAIISAWLCVSGALHYSEAENAQWEMIGLVALAILLILIYFTWCTVALSYHIRVYRKWQSNNQVVRIVATHCGSRFKRLRTFSSASHASDVMNNNAFTNLNTTPLTNLNTTPPLAASSPVAVPVDYVMPVSSSPLGDVQAGRVRYSRSEGSTVLSPRDHQSLLSILSSSRFVRETCV